MTAKELGITEAGEEYINALAKGNERAIHYWQEQCDLEFNEVKLVDDTPKEKLPLLIGEITTQIGMKKLERRLHEA
jgi:hypothetical protein